MKTTLTALAVTAAGFAAAAQDPLEYIEARQEIMKFIGGQMRTLGGMQRGRVEFDAEHVRATGKAIAAMAKAFPLLFPEGTEIGGHTEAAPDIFDDPGNFRKLSSAMGQAGNELQRTASQEQLQQLFRNLNDSCKSCHSRFRQ